MRKCLSSPLRVGVYVAIGFVIRTLLCTSIESNSDPCVVIVQQQQQPSEQHNEKQHVVNTNKTHTGKTAALAKHVTQKMSRAGDTVTTKVTTKRDDILIIDEGQQQHANGQQQTKSQRQYTSSQQQHANNSQQRDMAIGGHAQTDKDKHDNNPNDVNAAAGENSSFRLDDSIESQQSIRQAQVKTYCDMHQDQFVYNNYSRVSRLTHRPHGIFVGETKKVLYCAIPKIGFSHWIKIIIHLNGNISYNDLRTANYSTIFSLYHDKYELSAFKPEQIEHKLLHYFKFVFVRHPLERLLSAYEDKFGKKSAQREQYTKKYGPFVKNLCYNAPDDRNPFNITFADFLCYASRAPSSQLDIHWLPYVEICDFCNPHWNFDFIGKFEKLQEEANYLLDKFKVSDLRFPSGYRSKHEQRLRFKNAYSSVPPKTVEAILKRFQSDFLLFDYNRYPYDMA